MTNKFSIKSILAVGLVVIMSPTASAIVTYSVSGCTAYKKSLNLCSVFVDGILKGLGNVTNNPTAFTVTMSKISGTLYKNPANNALSNGVPFIELPVDLTQLEPINPTQVTKNGKALADVVLRNEVNNPRIQRRWRRYS